MIANAIMFTALVWSGYKSFTADTRDDALMWMVFIVIPIILTICGVQFSPSDN
jgi:hypothetical protein